MSGMNEEARIPVYIDDEMAVSALKNLQGEANRLRKAMYDAMSTGDMKGMKEAERELKKTNQQMADLKKSSFDVSKVLSNLSSASVKDLNKTLSALRREQEGLNRNSKEYIAIQKKIEAVKGEFKQINGQITEQKSGLAKLKDVAGGLLPAFGWGAIAAGAGLAFRKIIASTDELSTKWEIFTSGLKEGMNAFFRTMATGDWSNFFTNIENAIKAGREYAAVLDDLEAKQRTMTVAEADALKTKRDLLEKVRNAELSQADRIKAGKELIALEERLSGMRTQIAKEGYDNEMMMAMDASKLSKERIEELIKDFDSGMKAKAEAYNSAKQELDALNESEARISARTGRSFYSEVNEKKKKELTGIINATDQATKEYAADMVKLNNATDNLLDKTVAAYKGVAEAENSAYENTSRVRTQVHSMTAKENKVKSNELKEITFVSQDELQKQYENEMQINELLLKANRELAEGKIENLEDGINKEIAAENNRWENEKADLEARLVFKENVSAKEMELNNKIFGLIEEQQAQHNKKIDALKNAKGLPMADAPDTFLQDFASEKGQLQTLYETRYRYLQEQYERERELAGNNHDALLEAERRYSKEAIRLKQDEVNAEFNIVQRRLGNASSYVDVLAGIIDEQSNLGRALFLFQQGLAIADIWIKTAAANATLYLTALTEFAASGPYAPALAAAWSAAPIAAANANAALNTGLVAAQTVARFIGKKDGGYADYDKSDDTVAGFYHANEFIASAHAVRNPTVKPVLDLIDMAQRSGRIANLNLPAALGMAGRRSGGYAESSGLRAQGTGPVPSGSAGMLTDPRLIRALERMNEHLDKGIEANLYYRKFEEYNKEVEDIRNAANL